ncbi:GNAT family N-acetyltransferase [Arenibacterium sp. CAU 1754]
MDPLTDPVEVSPTDAGVRDLIETHLELMYASSPACSVHAMKPEDMVGAGVRFYAVFDGDDPVAMGAIKRIETGHGEVKSMHVRAPRRGQGLADRILLHLVQVARADGLTRLSLETGSQDIFAPARAFYQRHGFDFCPPYEGYEEDPASVFMTRIL